MDGTEYREGITRCPEHDVDLVDEPLEPEEDDPPLLELLDDRFAMRLAFKVLLAAAAAYALGGTLLSILTFFPSVREAYEGGWETTLRGTQVVTGASWSVGFAAMAVLGGAVLVRTYSLLRRGRLPGPAPDAPPPLGEGVMRLLFVLVLLFAALYGVTGVAIAWANSEYSAGLAFGSFEDPSQTQIALNALHSAAYSCGVGAFAVMAASLVKRTYDRMSSRG